jgi:hypothetical protein
MSAKVLELPARIRCDHVARELREDVTGVLNEIHRQGGDAAFHRAARDLVGRFHGSNHMPTKIGSLRCSCGMPG